MSTDGAPISFRTIFRHDHGAGAVHLHYSVT